MSSKKYFEAEEKEAFQVIRPSTVKDLKSELESIEYVKAYLEDRDKFLPHIDFNFPRNFAVYGSAKKYYEDSIERIYNTYPYDGSQSEKILWHSGSTYLDIHIFENEYPRTTGYALLSADGWGSLSGSQSNSIYGLAATPEHIFIKGGPHKDTIYNTGSYQDNNLHFDLSNSGSTVEFWLKKDAFVGSALTKTEVIFDLHNGTSTGSNGVALGHSGRFRVELQSASSGPVFLVTANSGTSGFYRESIGTSISGAYVVSGDWNHYAFALANTGSSIKTEMYVNGKFIEEVVTGSSIGNVTGAMVATIGSLVAPPYKSGSANGSLGASDVSAMTASANSTFLGLGWGKLSGSIDEFRYWKSHRTGKDIGKFWFTQVFGGTNSDPANVNLGVYYKFNEGITTTSTTDSVVLDYSGRISNGTWTGYTSNSRNTGSAMVSSSAAAYEWEDPIVYSSHPTVANYYDNKIATGTMYDDNNDTALYHTLPGWIIEEDDERGQHVLKLTQVLGSYLDTLHCQIKELPKIASVQYYNKESTLSGSEVQRKPYPWSKELLESKGFVAPDIFVDADILEILGSRDFEKEFKKKLHDVKNLIYNNINNNLAYINKSKGTEKAFRNLLRCFGISDEVVKLNMYADNITYDLQDNYRGATGKKRYVNFNNPDRHEATIYQTASADNVNSVNFVSGSGISGSFLQEKGMGLTTEVEVIFPKKLGIEHQNHFHYFDLTSSIAGCHTVDMSKNSTDMAWDASDFASFQIIAIKDEAESKNVKFMLTGSGVLPRLTSSMVLDVYDNQKWNFAVKIKPQGYPFGQSVTGATDHYTVEFQGVNSIFGEVYNEFKATGSISAANAEYFLSSPKRFFVGAYKTNFTGSTILRSDVKISSFRHWMDYLTDDIVRHHAHDATNAGTDHPYRSAFLMQESLREYHIPQVSTLAIDWNFETVSGSDASGEFIVEDSSSGSLTNKNSKRYGWLSDIVDAQHTARGVGFSENDNKVAPREYLYIAKKRLPEIINSSDMIQIRNEDDQIFTKDTRPIEYFFSIEKSMYQNISDEMTKMFSTIKDLNNLMGEMPNHYRPEYKDLTKLRGKFFEKIENDIDFDKYVSYYKWIDSALGEMLMNLVPASANSTDRLRNVVESHVLERNKYPAKFPTMEFKTPEPEGRIKAIKELTYNWKYGHAPVDDFYFKENFQRRAINSDYWDANYPTGSIAGEPVPDIRQGAGNKRAFCFRGAAEERFLTFKKPLRGDVTVRFDFIKGDNTEYSLEEPDQADATDNTLLLQYSTNGGASWTTGLTIEVTDGSNSSFTEAQHVFSGISGDYIIRWAQTSFSNFFPEFTNDFDNWAISNIRIIGKPQNRNCFWWKERADRDIFEITTQVSDTDAARQKVKNIIVRDVSSSAPQLRTTDSTQYEGSAYVLNRLTKPYKFSTKLNNPVGGTNFSPNKKIDYYKNAIGFEQDYQNVNSADCHHDKFIHIHRHNFDLRKDCDDALSPPVLIKEKVSYKATSHASRRDVNVGGKNVGQQEDDYLVGKGDLFLPFNIVRRQHPDVAYDNIADDPHINRTGYARLLEGYKSDIDITNVHHDLYADFKDSPLQGPFAEKHVGGGQHRHANLNVSGARQAENAGGFDTSFDRAEAWHLKIPTFLTGAVSGGIFFKTLLSTNFGTDGNFDSCWTTVSSSQLLPWSLTNAETPSSGTGPSGSFDGGTYYSFTETSLPNMPGKTFALQTPLVDAIDITPTNFEAKFYYHMHGHDAGVLKLQLGTDADFNHATDLEVDWNGVTASYIAGEQHATSDAVWHSASVNLSNYAFSSFYLRFLYVGGATHESDVAVDSLTIEGTGSDSFRLYDHSYLSTSCPRAPFYREEYAKRPVNVKNIKMTASGPTIVGNYMQTYEYFNTTGRADNNIWFHDVGDGESGPFVTQSVSQWISGVLEYTLPTRSVNNSIIVDRFSSPGGPEVMSRGQLDAESETYSPYNALPYRNRKVVNQLNFLSSLTCSQFGYFNSSSISTLAYGTEDYLRGPGNFTATASFHKTHRNALRRIIMPDDGVDAIHNTSAGLTSPFVTGVMYDNFFVTHQIPRSVRQYAWITSSLSSSRHGVGCPFGFERPGSGSAVKRNRASNEIIFVSGALIGQEQPHGGVTPWGWGEGSFILTGSAYGRVFQGAIYDDSISPPTASHLYIQSQPNDVLGLETTIYDIFRPSDNTLGWPLDFDFSDPSPYVISHRGTFNDYAAAQNTGLQYINGLYISASAPPAFKFVGGNILHNILLNRGSQYGYPSWKQTRTGQHPIARWLSRNNVVSIHQLDPETPTNKLNTFLKVPRLTHFSESNITTKYRPLVHLMDIKSTNDPIAVSPNIEVVSSYGNNLCAYNHEKINLITAKLFADRKIDNYIEKRQTYNDLLEIYKEDLLNKGFGTEPKPFNPISKFKSIRYGETIYPRAVNTYLKKIRGRHGWAEVSGTGENGYDGLPTEYRNFWRDDIFDRRRNYGFINGAYSANRVRITDDRWTENSLLSTVTTEARTPIVVNSQGHLIVRKELQQSAGGGPYTASCGGDSIWPLDDGREGSGDRGVTDDSESQYWRHGLGIHSGAVGELYFGAGFYSMLSTVTFRVSEILVTTASQAYHETNNLQVYNSRPLWRTNKIAGRNPWYDSYEEYSKDIRYMAQDHTIIPEFIISEHMDYYVKQKGGNFLAENTKIFKLKGVSGTISASADSEEDTFNTDFYTTYSHSDFMKHFQVIAEDHKDIPDVGVNRITLKCSGIKKLLPYNGFYPVNRCMQLGQLFSQSYGTYFTGTHSASVTFGNAIDPGTNLQLSQDINSAGIMQTMLKPTFSPGIMYNTIKAGIAVDYPLVTGTLVHISSSASGRGVSNDPNNHPMISGSVFNYRLPFEAIIDLRNGMPISSSDGEGQINLYGNYDAGITCHAAWNHGAAVDPLYTMAAHNFFAEVPNFFLKEGKFKSFRSAKRNDFKAVTPGKTYYMDVSLRISDDWIQSEGAREANDVDFRARRGAIYGPNVRFQDDNANDIVVATSNVAALKSGDPAPAPYTPPYFYGKSTARLSYYAHKPNPTLDEILADIQFSASIAGARSDGSGDQSLPYFNNLDYFKSRPTHRLNNGHGYPDDGWVLPDMARGTSTSDDMIELQSPALQHMMAISASVNLFGKKVLPIMGPNGDLIEPELADEHKVWVIAPKFECPILNFSASSDYHNGKTTKGIWAGYSTETPQGESGIIFSLEESYPKKLASSNPKDSLTGSLIDLLGMEAVGAPLGDSHELTKALRLGETADDFEKEISEAVVCIPFVRNPNKKFTVEKPFGNHYFFKIRKDIYDHQLANVNAGMPAVENFPGSDAKIGATSISMLIQKMKKYILPPRFDFLKNPKSVEPFVMYMFEFTHKLTRNDLVNIWQNVMPDIAMNAEKQEVVVSHKTGLHQFFHGSDPFNNDNDNFSQEQVEWMVFKVKKRAKTNYYAATQDISDDKKFKFMFGEDFVEKTPPYSFNWPYDFFSLVELAKVDAAVEIGLEKPFKKDNIQMQKEKLEVPDDDEKPAPDPSGPIEKMKIPDMQGGFNK